MRTIECLRDRADAAQRQSRFLGIGVAVVRKFGDDGGGNLAALITYYGFVSLFPLLLFLVTVLGYILPHHPGLQHSLTDSALADFPVIGQQIKQNVHSLRGAGLALILSLAGTLYGGLGLANATQGALNRIWTVAPIAQHGWLERNLRSLALMGTLGLAVVVTTLVGTLSTMLTVLGPSGQLLGLVVAFAADVALFALAFRILTAADISWRASLPGALVAGLGWVVLQAVGGALVAHQLQGTSATYGLFAIVLGLLAWIFLQARVFVYAAELNSVLHRQLWPRSLAAPPTAADARAHALYAERERRS